VDSIHAVSPDVSCEVSLDVSSAPALKNPSGSGRAGPARHAAARSPGKYLVRSGSVYLFQIRMPEDMGGRPARIVRIGLGALTARQAKLQAEMLAALARNRFEQIRMARMHDPHESRGQEAAFGGDSPEITAAEVKGYLKALHAILSQPAPPTPPHQKPAFDGMKGLVLRTQKAISRSRLVCMQPASRAPCFPKEKRLEEEIRRARSSGKLAVLPNQKR